MIELFKHIYNHYKTESFSMTYTEIWKMLVRFYIHTILIVSKDIYNRIENYNEKAIIIVLKLIQSLLLTRWNVLFESIQSYVFPFRLWSTCVGQFLKSLRVHHHGEQSRIVHLFEDHSSLPAQVHSARHRLQAALESHHVL